MMRSSQHPTLIVYISPALKMKIIKMRGRAGCRVSGDSGSRGGGGAEYRCGDNSSLAASHPPRHLGLVPGHGAEVLLALAPGGGGVGDRAVAGGADAAVLRRAALPRHCGQLLPRACLPCLPCLPCITCLGCHTCPILPRRGHLVLLPRLPHLAVLLEVSEDIRQN